MLPHHHHHKTVLAPLFACLSTTSAPSCLPTTLQAIKAGNTLYVSGQIGLVPGTKDFASEAVDGQTEQVRLRHTVDGLSNSCIRNQLPMHWTAQQAGKAVHVPASCCQHQQSSWEAPAAGAFGSFQRVTSSCSTTSLGASRRQMANYTTHFFSSSNNVVVDCHSQQMQHQLVIAVRGTRV